jgi:hypothetical protein
MNLVLDSTIDEHRAEERRVISDSVALKRD